MESGQRSGELRAGFRLVSKDDMVVGVVSQRAAVGLKGLAQDREVMPGGVLGN